jgi:hypothetical protein
VVERLWDASMPTGGASIDSGAPELNSGTITKGTIEFVDLTAGISGGQGRVHAESQRKYLLRFPSKCDVERLPLLD